MTMCHSALNISQPPTPGQSGGGEGSVVERHRRRAEEPGRRGENGHAFKQQ
jgi:hypothetical protein